MECVIDSKVFAKLLGGVGSIIPVKSVLPLCSCIRITVNSSQSRFEVLATDGDITARASGPIVSGVGNFSVVLNGKKIVQLAQSLESRGEIKITQDGKIAVLRVGESVFKIVTGPAEAEDFPKVSTAEGKGSVEIAPAELKALHSRVQFAVSTEQVRPALTGILFELTEKELRLVASDARRLALARKEHENKVGRKVSGIIPTKALQALSNFLDDRDEVVRIRVEESSGVLQTNDVVINTRLIEGPFPNYESVIPKNNELKFTVDAAELEDSLRMAAVTTQEKASAVKFILKDKKLTILSRTQDVGESNVVLETDWTGKEFSITFNPMFILDYLKSIDEKDVTFFLREPNTAALIKSNDNHLYVLMPLTVDL